MDALMTAIEDYLFALLQAANVAFVRNRLDAQESALREWNALFEEATEQTKSPPEPIKVVENHPCEDCPQCRARRAYFIRHGS